MKDATMWPPLVMSWFITPSNYGEISTINIHKPKRYSRANLAIKRGPHIVCGLPEGLMAQKAIAWEKTANPLALKEPGLTKLVEALGLV